MNILALSGSLRSRSVNTALLRAAARLAPPTMSITVFDGLGRLPLFNPDDEVRAPDAVARLRRRVAVADALIIASPEYAHGVTGTIKNALDWLVAFEPFVHKPVAVLNAAPRAHHADATLRETLRTMAAVVVEPASITLPLLGTGFDEDAIVASRIIAASIRAALTALRDGIASDRNSAGATASSP